MTARRIVGAVALVLLLAVTGACESATVRQTGPVERVLIVSVPGVGWSDVSDGRLPTLAAFADRAAIGSLSTRVGRRGASTTDAYLTIGAGTRALAPTVDVAVALDPDESYGGIRTADVLRRRLGRVPEGVAYLAVGAARLRNETSGFGAEPGRLGGLLAAAGIDRAVIANADAAEGFPNDEPPPDGSYARGAATVLMGPDGIVPAGTVGRGLLQSDPTAAFGRRLDHQAALQAFDEVWGTDERVVVLVEASDLSRASAYAARATDAQGERLRADALATADQLLAALLERTAPTRDAVVVVSPVAVSDEPELAVIAVQAPGIDGGLLRSSTTRRDGYVQLADIAPTVLELLGEDAPSEIEGRSMEARSAARFERVDNLADEIDAAERRDHLMPIVVPTIIAALAVLVGMALAGRLRGWSPPLLAPGSLIALGVVPATFAASHVPGVRGAGSFLLVTLALACMLGAVTWLVDRRRHGLGPMAAVGAIVGLFVIDVLVGAPLQVNAAFGYSVAVAGRFVGVGNLAFALFAAAAIVLAGLIVDRFGERGVPWMVGLFIGVVLVEGLPMLGADVGGVLSMVPAFGVTALLLVGRRVRLRHLVALATMGVATVVAFAFVDVARDESSRTHLARLADHLVNGRWDAVGDSLSRRLQASFGGAELGAWAVVIALIVAVGLYALLVQRGAVDPTHPLGPQPGPMTAVAVGLVVLAALGLVMNDSSIAVPTTMLIVAAPAAVLWSVAHPGGASRVDMDPS